MSFKWNGATISAREFTIGDDDNLLRFQGKLPDEAIVHSGTPFIEFMAGAVIDGDSPVPHISPDSPPAEIAAAYDAWLQLPRRFLKLWKQEVENANSPDPKG